MIQWGTVGEWLGAVVSFGSAIVAVWALIVARRADEKADQVNAWEAQLSKLRERRELASYLQCWWACSEENEDIGVVVVNGNTGAGVFRSVEIRIEAADQQEVLRAAVIPPGSYIFRRLSDGWSDPEAVSDGAKWNPIMAHSDRRVSRMEYIDQVGQYWIWTPESGLLQPGQ